MKINDNHLLFFLKRQLNLKKEINKMIIDIFSVFCACYKIILGYHIALNEEINQLIKMIFYGISHI